MGADQLGVWPIREDWAEGVVGTEGEWYSEGQGFCWVMGPESIRLPEAALGFGAGEGVVLTNCSVCSGSPRMYQIWSLHRSKPTRGLPQQQGPGRRTRTELFL